MKKSDEEEESGEEDEASEEEVEDEEDDDEDENNMFSVNQSTQKDGKGKSKKKKKNSFNQVTMLTPSNPAAKVIVNQTNKTVHKKLKRGQPVYEIAPGKGKVSLF